MIVMNFFADNLIIPPLRRYLGREHIRKGLIWKFSIPVSNVVKFVFFLADTEDK